MIDLFEHNRQAYTSVVTMLRATGKAAVVHPTGTGKSFIAFKLCEDHPDKTICWLSPSEYIFRTQLENLRRASGFVPENIRFFTYAKLMLLTGEALVQIQPDYIILDEFHRCGAQFWGQGVRNLLELFPQVPIVGLSATSIRYLDNQRDMADELFDGSIASEMTLGEAIVRGILVPPKYVLSVFSWQEDLERYEKRARNARSKAVRDKSEEYLEALRRALDLADGLDRIFEKHIPKRDGKYIVFCSSLEHMDEMIAHVPEWFGGIDETPNIYRAYSNDPATSRAFAGFKADDSGHLKLLFCIDMLNEGVHVEDISGVILFRPTVSPIVYKQQIGRAMSAGKKRDTVIFDIVNNFSSLYSIGAVEEEIGQAMAYFRDIGEGERIVQDRFDVIDEVRNCRRLFDELENVLGASWEYMYHEAKAYYEENGDLLVPSKYVTAGGYGLGAWLVAQRGVYNGTHEGVLTEEQIQKLEAIGMDWAPAQERMWELGFQRAKAHFEATDGLLPPYESRELKTWLYAQRKKYQENGLDQEKIRRLNELGMIWELDDAWEKMFALASDYYRNQGNLDIPAKYVTADGEALGNWYRRCVTESRKGLLSPERRQRLESIGFHGESVAVRNWMKYYAEAQKYAAIHGHLNIHADFVTESGLRLGTWISGQRYSQSRGRLPKQRQELLDALGMEWQRFDSKWEQGFSHLQEYKAAHGTAEVPWNYVTEDGFRLGNWLTNQRRSLKGEKLSAERAMRLEAVGLSRNR